MSDNWFALMACIVTNDEPDRVLSRMGIHPRKKHYIKDQKEYKPMGMKSKRDISVYKEWDRLIKEEGYGYKRIASEYGISYKTVCNLLMKWRPYFETNISVNSTARSHVVGIG